MYFSSKQGREEHLLCLVSHGPCVCTSAVSKVEKNICYVWLVLEVKEAVADPSLTRIAETWCGVC